MKSAARILAVGLVVVALAIPKSGFAAGNGTAAFEQLKSLVGHWETDKSNMNKATLDLELTSGGTAVLEKFRTYGRECAVDSDLAFAGANPDDIQVKA